MIRLQHMGHSTRAQFGRSCPRYFALIKVRCKIPVGCTFMQEGPYPTSHQSLPRRDGILRRSLVLLVGDADSDKTIFATQYLHDGASRFNEPGVYVGESTAL